MKASLSLNGYMLIDDKKATAEQVNAIIAERDAALAHNAELVAQVEVLKNHMAKFTEINSAFDAAAWENESALLRHAAPQQHLCDIQAEAGRAGFVAGYSKGWNDFDGTHGFRRESLADQYAERVKRGEL